MPRLLLLRLRLALLLAAVAACFGALVTVTGAPLAGPECESEFPRLCKFVDDLRDSIPEQIDASSPLPIRIGAYQIRQASSRPPRFPATPLLAPLTLFAFPFRAHFLPPLLSRPVTRFSLLPSRFSLLPSRFSSLPLLCLSFADAPPIPLHSPLTPSSPPTAEAAPRLAAHEAVRVWPQRRHRSLPRPHARRQARRAHPGTALPPRPPAAAAVCLSSAAPCIRTLPGCYGCFVCFCCVRGCADVDRDCALVRACDVARPLLGGIPIGELVHVLPLRLENTAYSEVGRAFRTRLYRYPNHQLPTTLWYHDHAIGITRLNVAAGLAGLFLLTDPRGVERTLTWLPQGEFEVPLALSDRSFFPNGSIDYPSQGVLPRVHPHWVPEYLGDTILVTGKVWPYLNVRRALYRFRVLGGGNTRFFNLRFICATPRNYPNFTPPFTGDKLPIIVLPITNLLLHFPSTNPQPSTHPCTSPTPFLVSPPVFQIGSDGGYLPQPAVRSSLLVAPGERYDILVDFSTLRSSCADVILTNDARAPFPAGQPVTNDTAVVMRFIVDHHNARLPAPRIPKSLVAVPPIDTSRVVLERWITAVEETDPATGLPVRLLLGGLPYSAPPTEMPRENSEELWHLINTTPDAHPIHLHLIQHRPLWRRPFDLAAYNGGACSFTNSSLPSCLTAAQQQVAAYERGWKDTTILPPGHVLTLWTPWYSQDGTPFPFDPTRGPGYVWHCHILEHEDNEMMHSLIITK
ncbi:unnamed protein product [Closterium sp. NIES-53]